MYEQIGIILFLNIKKITVGQYNYIIFVFEYPFPRMMSITVITLRRVVNLCNGISMCILLLIFYYSNRQHPMYIKDTSFGRE